ncbi:MAG: aminodeoxychorismate synthase, component I [Cellvibrionaceae bacterium]|nr:aminodeoxychorismate synthase, component I [Cellvibrionaceae bacterium]|tara:strand:+ start:2860 stop:4248 length:1389 start_codon:yes stop_codon:yes gene_type:complete
MTEPQLESIVELPLTYSENSEPIFSSIRDMEWPIWLDSGESLLSSSARYDIISAAPSHKLIGHNKSCAVFKTGSDQDKQEYANCWAALDALTPHINHSPTHPFTGGALGYLGYDVGRELETLEDQISPDHDLPNALMGIYQWAVIQDHEKQSCTLVHTQQCPHETIEEVQKRLATRTPKETKRKFLATDFKPLVDKQTYLEQVNRIQQYINSGDCYQVNFSQRFEANYKGDSFQAYLHLRSELQSPFSCFFETEFGAVLSLSPERFISCHQGKVTTQPIKGTAARGSNEESDRRLSEALRNSEKDIAENLMIVDLLRNDLSKCCEPNSVKTPKLFSLESYPNVHHLVSTVTGELSRGKAPLELLKACFPGGSITGAPKIRAMEIIEELEAHRRSVYCGSLGYISFNGNMDTSIAIRTAIAEKETIYIWGGGGIVADSVPEEEFDESIVKIRRIMKGFASISH